MTNTLKILHIGKYFAPFVGGIENVTEGLAKSSVEQGHEVTVLCHQHEPRLADSNNTISIHGGAYRVRKCRIIGKLLFTPLAPFFPSALKQELATNPDIVHIHMPNPSAFWLLLHKKKTNERWVIHWHSDVIGEQAPFMLRLFYKCYRYFEQQLLKKADAIVVTSPNYAASSEPIAAYRDKSYVIPIGIDIAAEDRVEPVPVRTERAPLKVLTVGRLTYYKGHQILINSIKQLEKDGVNVQLKIVGDGAERQQLEEMIHSLNLSDRICIESSLSTEQLHQVFRECDVFCLPSLERTEAFGVVLLEAMSFAKPCITTDIVGSGINYVVKNNETGIVVKVNDSQSLKNALLRFVRQPQLLNQMGEAGFKRVMTKFNLTSVANKVEHLYSLIIDKN